MDSKETAASFELSDLLTQLREDEFNKFKFHLSYFPLRHGKSRIPLKDLEKADQAQTASLMIYYYQDQYALKIAKDFLQTTPRISTLKISQHATQTHLQMNYKEYIKDKFRMMKDKYSLLGKHVTFQEEYKELTIVKSHIRREYKYHPFTSLRAEENQRMMPRRFWEPTLKKAANLSFSIQDLFQPDWRFRQVPSTIVLLGEAGIGKTMTARKIMLDWASGDLFQARFDYVFYIQCRELDLHGGQQTIGDLILHSCGGALNPSMSEIEENPKNLLFIIDGFDELKMPKDVLLADHGFGKAVISLMRSEYLPESSIIVTTRPTALKTLEQCFKTGKRNLRFAEIVGFPEYVTIEYFTKFFGNKTEAEHAVNIVKENAILLSMCSVPVVCWIVCTVVKQQMEKKEDVNSLKTIASVYLLLLSNSLEEHGRTAVHPIITMQLKRLCALAKEGIYQQTILFNKDDLIKHGIDIPGLQSLFPRNNIFQKDEESGMYSFIHLTVQEFFAVLFCVLGEDEASAECTQIPQPDDVINLLENYGKVDYRVLRLTVQFLFGLLNKEMQGQIERLFQSKISSDNIKLLLDRRINGEIKRCDGVIHNDNLHLIHCLYEIQDEQFIVRATLHLKSVILYAQSTRKRMTVVDFRALGFCLKNSPRVQKMHLSNIEMKAEGLSALLPGLVKCSSLIFFSCSLTGSCCKDLSSFLKHNSSLTELDLSYNKLQDSGVRELCKGLKHSGCKVQELRMMGCSLTGSCCAALSSVLQTSTSLTKLDLSYNELGVSGVRELCEGLKHPGCKILTLRMEACLLTGSCCAAISSVLKTNLSLTKLDLSSNKLQNSGVRKLCKGLKHSGCKIEALKMMSCSLTYSCCAALSSVFKTNTSLAKIILSFNQLKDSGVRKLCEGLKHPGCKIQRLDLRSTGLTDGSTAALCLALSTKRSLQLLDLWGNHFTGRSAASFHTLKETVPNLEHEELAFPMPLTGETYIRANNTYCYRATFPKRGTYICASTGLCFEVNRAGPIEYALLPWDHRLTDCENPEWMVAGPLFEIKADPGLVATVYLPHFIFLNGEVHVAEVGRRPKGWKRLGSTQGQTFFHSAEDESSEDESFLQGEFKFDSEDESSENESFLQGEFKFDSEDESSEDESFLQGEFKFDSVSLPQAECIFHSGIEHVTEVRGSLKGWEGLTSVMGPTKLLGGGGDVDISQIKIAHFQANGKMTLERPSEVQPFHVVLRDPTFSILGVLWEFKIRLRKPFPARACALLYQLKNPADVNATLHLHLIPNEPLLMKELDYCRDCDYKKIKKSAWIPTALYFDRSYTVESKPDSLIMPRDLLFMYRCPGQAPYYAEIYIKKDQQMEEMVISIMAKKNKTSVWEAIVRPVDFNQYLEERSTSPDAVDQKAVPASAKTVIYDVLMKLKHDQFKKFKFMLGDYRAIQGKYKIPQSKLEKAEHTEIAELMISHYDVQLALQVTQDLMKNIPTLDLLDDLHIASKPFF